MYYITNQNNQIIAIDPSLLALLEVENIDELYRKIALGDIEFSSSSEEEATITTSKGEESYHAQSNTLSGILGDITLVQIQASEKYDDTAPVEESIEEFLVAETATENEISILDNISEEILEENNETSLPDDNFISVKDINDSFEEVDDKSDVTSEISLLDDEPISFGDNTEELPEKVDEQEEEISLLDNDYISFEDTKETIDISKTENDDELFDLILPNAPEDTIDEISIFESETEELETEKKDNTPIIIDVASISREIGISTEDYNNFLNEYIDTALTLEEDLQSTQNEKQSHAISTLSQLSNILHLPIITKIVAQIENASLDTQGVYIESLYATLARLTTTQITTHEEKPLFVPESESVDQTTTTESFGTIDLEDVKPIHFDFQLERAANDLGLPIELIEEFVHDFIKQAHIETKKMVEAYEKGNLETIQKIGHLLKGASSNLRIKPLSDTLYEIQLCEDSSKLEELIKQYWGHFLSLETQINLTSK